MTSFPSRSESRGAYGLRLSGTVGAERLLVRADEAWPAVDVSVEVGPGEPGPEQLDDRQAWVNLRTGGRVHLEREPGRAVFKVPHPLAPDVLVHPYLAPVAAVSAQWYGRESLHSGAFALGEHVWGVVGSRRAGKSSLLAALAARDVDIVCDDVLVVDELDVFAGPRTIDLRADAAAMLEAGEAIGVAGARERWRLRLGPLDRRLRLAGWIFVAWAEATKITRLPATETLPRLLRNRGINVPPVDPGVFLQLSGVPAFELGRPKSWSAVPDALERLLAVASQSA